jgi:hypothetical protein
MIAIEEALNALRKISLGSQNSGTTKEDLGKEARTSVELVRAAAQQEYDECQLQRQRAELAEAKYEAAVEQLTSIYGLLSPPDVTVGDKTYQFFNAEVEHTMLRDLSRKIRDMPESLRTGPTALAADRYKYLREQAEQANPMASVMFRGSAGWVNVWDGKSLDEAVDQRRIMGILKREPK